MIDVVLGAAESAETAASTESPPNEPSYVAVPVVDDRKPQYAEAQELQALEATEEPPTAKSGGVGVLFGAAVAIWLGTTTAMIEL